MKKLLLNLYFWPAFVIVTLLGLLLVPFILLYGAFLPANSPSSSLRSSIRFYGWILVCAVPFMAPVKVIGNKKTIPVPSIFIANHGSAIDPYLFGAIPMENCFVTSWPFKIPIYSPLMKIAGYVNTADGWNLISRQCAKLLTEGVSIIVWPEGHRSRDGKLGRFRKGAFQLSAETGYPLQPVCILGSEKILYPGTRLLNPGRVTLILLDPIYPNTKDKDKNIKINNLRQKSFDAIRECIQHFSTETI